MKFILLFLFFALPLFAICKENEKTDTIPPPQISIMSWNIKMLPRGAFYLRHHPVRRAKLIPEKLKEEAPYVIVFQEAFDGLAIRILKRKLKKVYPFVCGTENRRVITYNRAGGVLMFSKYPMRELKSIRYKKCRKIDCKANKGALLVEVQHPVKKFQVLGTHMQAGGGNEIKLSQHIEAGELLKQFEQKDVPQFAAGDFNTHKNDTLLYPHLLKALEAEDGEISSELKFTSDHLLNDMQNYRPDKRSVIDFIFFKGNGVNPKFIYRLVKQFEKRWHKNHKDLSDHNAVVLKMNL